MKKMAWKVYLIWIALTEAIGALAAFLTRGGVEYYKTAAEKPPLSPPAIVFPIVWGILYLLMGIGAARVALSEPSKEQTKAQRIYLLQLAFNFFWSLIFFNLRAYAFSLAWLITLWVLILWMIVSFRKVDKAAGNLQIPYLLWVTFAGYLNAGVWFLNR